MENEIHPATEEDVINLRAFENSWLEVEGLFRNPTEIAANWWIIGMEDFEDQKRIFVLERSALVMSSIVGDGIHFGRVQLLSEDEVKEVIEKYRLHWE